MVKLAPVRSAFVDPDQVGALPNLVVLGPGILYGRGIALDARIRFNWRFNGHRLGLLSAMVSSAFGDPPLHVVPTL
jgi:hypothetical protein